MGSGDWNDGMNRVGAEGRGESVWLGWFLVTVLNDTAAVCAGRSREDLAQRYRSQAQWLAGTLELTWDGAGIGGRTSTTARRSGRCRTKNASWIR